MTTIPTWPWPDELDALSAAPAHHTLLLENEHVRVLRTLIPAGEKTAVHTHRWPGVQQIIRWSHFRRTDAAGELLLDSRTLAAPPEPGAVQWGDALPPHALEVVGDGPLEVVTVEVKGGNADLSGGR